MIGARAGQPNLIRRLISQATARHLRAFVVPGLEIARAGGLDLEAAGLRPVATPRRANVLVLISPLPDALTEAVIVTYAQMPRPRSILAVGDPGIDGLPNPDVTVDFDQTSLVEGVDRLRELISTSAWQPEIEPFQHESLEPHEQEEGGAMAHHHHQHGGNDGEEGHQEHQHGSSSEHEGHGKHEGHGDHEGHEDHSEHGQHEGHDMGMDHGGHGGGFMSMIAMTKDLPRSRDGLAMDWLETPFGPLHPGLPGGLNLTLTLDGDLVAGAKVSPCVTCQHLNVTTPAPARDFPAQLSQLDRLAPGVYQNLAEQAIEGGRGFEGIVALERARVLSHLNWLASFGYLLGYAWLRDEAASLHRELMQTGDVQRVRERVTRVCRRSESSFFLNRRLAGLGTLNAREHSQARGPVARAMGMKVDARMESWAYQELGFEPRLREEGDALARLHVRLDEIPQSLDLIQVAAEASNNSDAALGIPRPGEPTTIETPRGHASIHVTIENGQITHMHLDTPSTQHMSLIPAVAEGLEVSAGLIGIASLDLSPWEVQG